MTGPDATFAEWLGRSDVPADERPALLSYIEGFNTADANRIGILGLGAQQTAEDSTEGDRAWHIQGGYAQITEYLAGKTRDLGGKILLKHTVVELTWAPEQVEVITSDGKTLRAPRCIVSLPLGVLQRVNREGSLRMQPEPAALAHARRLDMGQVARFTMIFRTAWWRATPIALARETLANMSFLFTPEAVPGVWWTPLPEDGPAMLTGWVGGPRSEALSGKSAEDLGDEACRTLALVFGLSAKALRDQLLATYTHDWRADPLSLGAYSYVPAGALDAPRAMTEPEAGTLFFAGEHTDVTGHWGTVHAALRSGLRAAAQILGDATG